MGSSDDRDAEKKAEKLERNRESSGGTARGTGIARQTSTARGENADPKRETLLEEVLRRENVLAAYERVVRNSGAPGVDGTTVDKLMEYCQKHWARIREELLSETYQPQPVRKVDIPKPDGGTRTLGIPTVLDRMIQQALLQVLEPVFDPAFSDGSFGYRPGRSAQQAVARCREHIAAGYRWVVDLDIEKFFDRVNHDVLMARMARRVKDKRVLRLIRRYLQAGLMEGGLVSPRAEGTPQGGPLSPLLSNVLLDELDRELERRGHRFVRYAADSNVYVKSQAAGERVMASLERFLLREAPAEGEPVQERRGTAVAEEVSRLHRDLESRAEVEGVFGVDSTTEEQTSTDASTGARPKHRSCCWRTHSDDSGLGCLLPVGGREGQF